jgi:phage gp29-like protein
MDSQNTVWGPDATPDGNRATAERIEGNEESGVQFATRERANEFIRFLQTLPDPDPILRKMGKGITALKKLLADSHLESVWSVRCSSASGGQWFVEAGDDGAKEKQAADGFQAQLKLIDVPRVIDEMMEAVAYGYAPIEVLWESDGGGWAVADLVGKPQEWFEFDQQNRLVFKTGVTGTEELLPNRFLVVRHRPSYANPYGVKTFSKCFWPATFKKNGFRWWTVFVEKYGGAFLMGQYPTNASEQYKTELLDALDKMASDSVAIYPEGATIAIQSLANKGTVATVHQGYIDAANGEMSKAVLGQTLTTEINGTGSYAAAQTHNLVRQDLAASDRRRVCEAFNRLSKVWTFYNYGADVAAPRFEFVKDEDLQTPRSERDKNLFAIGWRPTKDYIEREYDMADDDFDVADPSAAQSAGGQGFSKQPPKPESENVDAHHNARNLLQKLFAKFAESKSDKQAVKDNDLMDEFSKQMLEAGQDELDKIIEKYADALGTVHDYKDADAALLAALSKGGLDDFAHCIDEVRFAASGIGARNAK